MIDYFLLQNFRPFKFDLSQKEDRTVLYTNRTGTSIDDVIEPCISDCYAALADSRTTNHLFPDSRYVADAMWIPRRVTSQNLSTTVTTHHVMASLATTGSQHMWEAVSLMCPLKNPKGMLGFYIYLYGQDLSLCIAHAIKQVKHIMTIVSQESFPFCIVAPLCIKENMFDFFEPLNSLDLQHLVTLRGYVIEGELTEKSKL